MLEEQLYDTVIHTCWDLAPCESTIFNIESIYIK